MKRLLFVLCASILGFSQLQADPKTPRDEAGTDDVQDVVYLGEGRPALLRLHLRLHGRSLFSRWDGFMDRLFGYLDRNQNASLDRLEAERLPAPTQLLSFFQGNVAFLGRQFGNVQRPTFETLDSDGDGRVTVEEMRAYYRGSGAGPVQFINVPAYAAGPNASTDLLFALLDANKDGKLSRKEVEEAGAVLASHDSNDDELIGEQELTGGVNPAYYRAAAFPRTMPGPTGQLSSLVVIPRDDSGKRKTAQLKVARELLTRFDKDKSGKLSPAESTFPAEAFARLDRNKDGQLDTVELVRWLTSQPEGEFTVRLGNATKAIPGSTEERMTLSLGAIQIQVVPINTGYVVPDSSRFFLEQFRQLDREKNGYVSRTRVGPQHPLHSLFDMADRNGDGRLTEQELQALLDLGKEGAGMPFSLLLAPNGDGLFQTLDANGDRSLSVREIRNAWKLLAAFDRDEDQAISRTEFPRQFRLSVSTLPYYGFATRSAAFGQTAPAPQQVSLRGPLWFRKMDTNGDGDVSRREWLGSLAAFDTLDADRDGLISVAEAEARR